MSQLSAYGVNLTPPNPVSYNLKGNVGNIANIIGQANTANNQANAANNQRYGQMLGVLGNAATGQQGFYNQAQQQLGSGYANAQHSLSGSLANNQTVFNNENTRVGYQAQEASSAAGQSAISRGLGNTTIANSMQDQVTRAANDAYANTAAAKAQADNGVYQNIANLYSAQGTNSANLSSQQGGAYMGGGTTIANAIQGRTDQAPSLSEYASLIQAAQAAQNSQGKNVINTTNPVSINSPLNNGKGLTTGGGGGISGGIGASMGQGGFSPQMGMGSGGGIGSGGGAYYGPGYGTNNNAGSPGFIDSLPGGNVGGGTFEPQSGGEQSLPSAPNVSQAGTPDEVPQPGQQPGQGPGKWAYGSGAPGSPGYGPFWIPTNA